MQRDRNSDARFAFTGTNGGPHRQSNFRRRFWLAAVVGAEKKGWLPVNEKLHFYDLRYASSDVVGRGSVPRLMRRGHKHQDVDDLYSQVTEQMIEETLAALQRRGGRTGPELGRSGRGAQLVLA